MIRAITLIASFVFSVSALAQDDGFGSVIQKQSRALMDGANSEQKEEDIKVLDRRLKDKLSDLYFALYEQAINSGIRFDSARQAVDDINWSREKSGVWHISAEFRDGDNFVILQDFMTGMFDSAFNVSGYGLVSASGEIDDPEFKKKGHFGPGCQYRVSLGDQWKQYPCEDFLEGRLDSAVVLDMKHMFNDHLDSLDRRRK